jgi:OOP family OmpA-OmpF porin
VRFANRSGLVCATLGALLALLAPKAAQAQTYNNGYQLNRYEPTAAGEWSFWVDHPWYSSTRYFAAGLTLNYGHHPLVFGTKNADGSFTESQVVIGHQLLGHLDLAGSFLDRVNVSLSLPITFLERGTDVPLAGILPRDGGGVGDPRLGAMVRLWKQPDADPISISLGAYLWIPLRAGGDGAAVGPTTGEQGVRFMPKLAVGGLWNWLRWSATLAFYYRPEATLGNLYYPGGSKTGSEIQLGLSAYYADKVRRFAVGPELLLAGQVIGPEGETRDHTSLEILIGAHYNIAKLIQVGLAGGFGVLRQPGTPDGRFLLRVAYAPIKDSCKDQDSDGICDAEDACPQVRGIRTGDHRTHGCPPGDRDGDGIFDNEDRCPDEPKGPTPDPERRGCPLPDRDRDGIPDKDDLCPDVHKGATPDPARLGCPIGDRDGDGVMDPDDQCPDQPAGLYPDTARPGCPLADRDGDNVPDVVDACPDKPGSPSTNPRKHGCPGGLAMLQGGQVKIMKPVFFAFDKDVILATSYPTLQAVAEVLKAVPSIRKLRVEGHTDGQGNRLYNIDLSDRRAKSVMRWLIEHGIDASRLTAQGFGPDQPIAPNTTVAGRAKNRRVVFEIVDGSGAIVEPPK